MDEAAVRVFWSPSPPAHAVTSVAVDVDRAWVYTGSSDGAIVRWQLQGAVAPKAYVMLVGHTRPIRHLAPGLKDPGPGEGDEGRYLLSVDNGGGCCLWREPCGRCVLQRWIPQLGSAIFGHLPPDRCGPFAASEWLLAAMPAVCAGEPTLQTNRPHHPQPHLPQHQHHQHHHHHHHQQQQHCQQSAAPTPSLHGMRSTGSGRQAEGGGGGGPEEATALCDGVIKSKAPTLLVIDWQSLSVIQVLYMHPLQQLVCVDMPAATAKFRFSSGSGRGGSGGRPSSPTSQQRPVPPPWAEGTSGGCDKPDPSSVLLCLPWGCCAAPSRDGAGADNASGTDSKSNHGDADGDTTVIIALALTPMGTLYGCVVPYDPYKPPAWVLGYGGARNAQDGGVVAADVSLGGETRYVDAGRPLDREGQEEPAEPLMEVHEPLLSAAVSANLRWALLGAVDSWIVLEAQWSAMQPPAGSAASMSTEATSTPAPPSGAGSHKVLPRLLQMSYTPKCRISLMHQPGAGMVAMAGLTVRNRPQSPPPPSQRSRPQQLPQWPGGIQGGQGSGGSGSFFGGSCGGIDSQEPEGISSVCGLDPVVVPGSGRHTYAISAPTGLAPNSHLVGAAKEVGQQPLLIRTAAHLLLLGTWEEEELPAAARVKATGEAATATTAAGLVAAARQPYPLSGMAGPAAATSITATAAAAAAATAQPACHEAGSARPCELERHLAGSGLSPISLAAPPCPAAAPNAATCSDTLTSPSSGSMAATAAGKGIDVPRPPTPAAATAAAAAAIAVAGSTLESRVGDCDDEMLTETFSPDLARLSFAVYLPPHSDDGSSAASSLSVQQLRQAQSPPMGAKQQQQQQQQQQQPRPQLLPPNGSAQMSSGATAAMDSRHGSGEGQQSHSQLHSRSMLHEQQLQPQLSGLPPAVPKGEVSGLQVNLETAATGGDGGGDGGGIGDGGGGSTMAAIVGDAGPQQTSQLQQQQQQSLHGESGSFCMSLNQASARPIHHWHRRTNHHYHHHHGHDVSTSGAVVLQALSWDGAGRQQVVSLTSDGRILTVRELSSPAPPAPATDSFGTMEARETVWSPVSAPSPLPEALSCRAFCCYLPAQSVGDGVCNLGGGNNDGSGSGSVSRNAGAGLGGWVLGVHCYHGDARPATASVLQWPLLRQQSLPDVVLQAPPLAAEAAAAGVRAASSTDMERSLAEVNSVPLVGSLHDGWAVAAAAMWRAHTVRRRRRCRTSQRHGCGRPSSGAVTAAIVDHGAVWDSACEECPGGGCSARGTLRRYGGYDAVRDDRSDGGGNAMDDDDDDVVLDSKVDRMGRHIDGVSTTKLSYSGNGFAAAPAAAINSGGGDSLYGPPAAPEVPCRHDGGGRIRRDSSGDRGCRRLPACLYERWDARREGVSWSGGKRDCTAQQQDFPAVAKARNDGVDVGIASSVSNYPPATVVSASVLVCDGTAVGEAVVLHCMADGAIHYCGMGAYSVPSVAHWCTADDRLKHAQSSLLRASVRGHGEDGCGQGDVDGGHYDYAAAGGGNCGESSWIPAPPLTPPPAVMRPGRAGIMRGHIGPVTCQLEVLVSMMPAGGTAAAAAAARTAAANPPASPPYLPSHAHPILSDAASASGGDGANSSGSCAVRVLLTGGSDGSLRGWHTHAAVFGSPAFALHPHGAAVGRVLLPRGSETHAPPEFRQCVVSAAEDGSLALVCLERGCVIRVCRTYPYGMPEIVSWSFRRGFLACGGRDAAGQWTVAVFDIAPTAPSLDRIAVGSEAATILDVGVTSMSSSPYTSATTDAGGGQAVQRPLATPPLHQSAHHLSPSMPQVSHQHQGGLLTHPPVQHSHRTYLPPPPLPLHHTHTHVQALPHLQQQWQQKQSQHPPPPPPPYKQSSGLPGLIPPLLGHNSDGGGGGGGSGRRPWLHPVPHVGRPGCTASSASMPAPATLVAASSSSPSLAPVWAYGGSFRTIYCHRPDVLLAAINSEALLAKLSAAAMATAVPAAMTVSSPATSSPLPMPGRPGTRGLVVARSSPCQPPYGLSPSHGVLFPPNASPNQLSMSASPSREASLDLGTAVAAAATGATEISAAVSRDHSPAALPSTSVGIAAVAGCASRGSASRFSIEADRSVGGRSIGGASAGSSRLSLDVPSPPDALRMGAAATDLSGMKALAALTSILHPWASDSRVDSALLEVLVLLGILIGHRDGDPWVSGGGGGGRGEDATACSSIVAVATHESVSCHRAHSAPEGQVPFGSDGDCGRERGTSTAAAAVAGVCIGIGIGGASTGVQSATIAGAKPAAGLGGLSVGSSPQGQCLYGETQLPARRQIPDPHFEAQTDDGLSGETSRGPCLVQPALVSACGSVALGMPQAPETHGADPWVVGDPTTAAARLLHIVSLAGTLGSLGERGPPPAAHDATVYRAAVRAASCVRHLCLVTARNEVVADRAAAAIAAASVQLPPPAATPAAAGHVTKAHSLSGSCCRLRLHEPDLAMFARRWLAPDPWVREAARQLLSAYTKPWPLDTATSSIFAHVAEPYQSSPPLPLPAGEVVGAPSTVVRSPGKVAGSWQPLPLLTPLSLLLPSQAMQLLQLRNVMTSDSSQSAAAANAALEHRHRSSGGAPSQLPPPPPPQHLYPAAIIAGAACLAHPDAVPRHLFDAAAASLVELLCLPLTLSRTSAEIASVGAAVTDVPAAAQSALPHQQPALPLPPPQQSSGLWVDGRVLLPEVAAAMLTAALSSPAAAQWRQQLQPWPRFVDRMLHLVHAIPLPTRGPRAVSHDAAVPHEAAAGGQGPMGHIPHRLHPPVSPPPPAAAGTPQRAALQLADQAVKLLAAAAELDLEAMLEGMLRFAGGESLPLHPLVAAALTRLAARCPGRRRLAVAAPALGALLASCAAAPATRGRPDLARPAFLAAADLAAALPCAALHANSMQLAVAPPLAADFPSGEPQYAMVYDLEHGHATWQLPLQPGPGALQPLPTAAAALLATSAAAATAIDAGDASSMAATVTVAVGGGGGVKSSFPCPASSLPEVLRSVGQGGVAALQFSPQGDHLAVLVMDGTPTPALLVYSLHLPWSHKLLMLPGAPRPTLVIQPCHGWLLPGLLQLIQPPSSPPSQPKQRQEHAENSQRNQSQPLQLERGEASTWSGCAAAVEGVEIAELRNDRRPRQCSGEEIGGKEGEGEERASGAGFRNCGQMQDEGPEAGRRQEVWQPAANKGDRDARLMRVIDRVFGLRWSGQSCVELLRDRTAILARFVLPFGA